MDVMRHAVIFWTSPTQPHVSQHSYVSVVCIAFSSRSIVRMTPDTLSWKGNHRRRVLSSKILERTRFLPPLSPSDITISPSIWHSICTVSVLLPQYLLRLDASVERAMT